MRITYIILAFLIIQRLNTQGDVSQYNLSRKCRFWFELCQAETPSEYKSFLVSKSEYGLQKIKSELRELILKNENKDLRGIFSVLYLAEWDIIERDNEIFKSIDYFSLIFLLVISGFHFNIASSVIDLILMSFFSVLNVSYFIPSTFIVLIKRILLMFKILILFYFCQFYAFNPSVVRAYIVELSKLRDFIKDFFGIKIVFIDYYLSALLFGVDIFSISYFLSWMCYLIFSSKFHKISIIDIFLKGVMSSFLCLALFGRLSILSLPIAMIWSHFFIFAYLSGLLVQFFPSTILYTVNSIYWLGLAKVYEYLKDYDYVLLFNGFRESSIILLIILFIIFLSTSSKMEKNLWKERVY